MSGKPECTEDWVELSWKPQKEKERGNFHICQVIQAVTQLDPRSLEVTNNPLKGSLTLPKTNMFAPKNCWFPSSESPKFQGPPHFQGLYSLASFPGPGYSKSGTLKSRAGYILPPIGREAKDDVWTNQASIFGSENVIVSLREGSTNMACLMNFKSLLTHPTRPALLVVFILWYTPKVQEPENDGFQEESPGADL